MRVRGLVGRLSAIGAAAFAGAVASLVFAAPASAHMVTVSGDYACDRATGDWRVTWEVLSSEDDITGELTYVALLPGGSTVTNIAAGAVLPESDDGPLAGEQILPSSATGATLKIWAKWIRPYQTIKRYDSESLTFSGTCAVSTQAQPSATFEPACDGSVTVGLTNAAGATAAASFEVLGDGGFTDSHQVQPGESLPAVVPAAHAQKITIKVGDETVAEGGWQEPDSCDTPVGGGDLPATGTDVGIAAAVGVALLGAGTALVLLSRSRRRLRTG